MVNSKKGPKTVEDFQKSKEVKLAFSGVGSDDYYNSLILSKYMKLNIAPISGYSGSAEANLSAAKGETEGVEIEYSSIVPLIKSGDLTPVLQISAKPDPQLPNVPTAIDEAKRLNLTDAIPVIQTLTNSFVLDRVFFAPPGILAIRLKVLSGAMEKAAQDPDFGASLKKANRPWNYISSADVASLAKSITEGSASLTSDLKAVDKQYNNK